MGRYELYIMGIALLVIKWCIKMTTVGARSTKNYTAGPSQKPETWYFGHWKGRHAFSSFSLTHLCLICNISYKRNGSVHEVYTVSMYSFPLFATA